ncbi:MULTISPECIES: bactofilin family protein [Shewanella]|uniref:Polymer-forming cytoskeletal protein n=2 Tax=Shewanella TaxID=22 RepID=A0AAJ1EXF4_9GAMM|nr:MULTISPECIES: polymer-forming cytoskeletal protein [Shewanella]AZQ11064.1 Polymer-forming cytoskeletal [Shewanella khirikhana]MCH4293929.1 polymer-forming cytoskeletal protein [Shewanella zhuhaiensis]
MFGKNNKSQAGLTFISPGTRLSGETRFEGDALIGGELLGTIHALAKVTIEPDGVVDGVLHCNELKVSGLFKGKLQCTKLTIANGGTVEGEVKCDSMEIFEGGQFIGIRTRDSLSGELLEANDEEPVLLKQG